MRTDKQRISCFSESNFCVISHRLNQFCSYTAIWKVNVSVFVIICHGPVKSTSPTWIGSPFSALTDIMLWTFYSVKYPDLFRRPWKGSLKMTNPATSYNQRITSWPLRHTVCQNTVVILTLWKVVPHCIWSTGELEMHIWEQHSKRTILKIHNFRPKHQIVDKLCIT